ncbi:MAG: cupredoxin domain-containing protein [Rhizobacter sp.]
MRFDSTRRALIGAAGLLSIAGLAAPQTPDKIIRITARKFEFEPRHIALKMGEAVVLEFNSQDVIMGFNLNAFGLRTDIVPGQTSSLRFTPDKTGEFVFYCDVFCGNGHEEMDGTLSVTA